MKTVDNAIRALSMLSPAQPQISVTEVSRRLGIPKSSASRLLASLRKGGLLDKDPATGRYKPGFMTWQLGMIYQTGSGALDLVQGAMDRLVGATGYTTWLAVLRGTDIIVLRNRQGTAAVQFVVRPGQRLPAHSTAIGKALLARLPEMAVRKLYAEGLEKRTENTIRSVDDLIAELREVSAQGWARSRQETFPGIEAIAVGFDGFLSEVPVGLGVSFPVVEGQEIDREGIRDALFDEAIHIGERIGDQYWIEMAERRAG